MLYNIVTLDYLARTTVLRAWVRSSFLTKVLGHLAEAGFKDEPYTILDRRINLQRVLELLITVSNKFTLADWELITFLRR